MKTILLILLVATSALAQNSQKEAVHKRAQEMVKPDTKSKSAVVTNKLASVNSTTNLAIAPASYGADAYYSARKFIQQKLKAPSTAKFSNPGTDTNTGWSPDGYFQWKTFGYVDAQNSFGATTREQWSAVVQYNVGIFEIVYMKLGDQTVGQLPPTRRAPGH